MMIAKVSADTLWFLAAHETASSSPYRSLQTEVIKIFLAELFIAFIV